MSSRRELRAEMRRRRRAISGSERNRHGLAVARRLNGSILLRRSARVACYLANDGEMDLGAVTRRLNARRRKVFVPVLHGRRLWFLPLTAHTPLVDNRFGIAEPNLAASMRCPAAALDLVLMPLVAFDSEGNRLGMGGGFYDRTFAYLRNRRVWMKPCLIGVAYEFQRLEKLAKQPWDIRLDGVVTEKRMYWFD